MRTATWLLVSALLAGVSTAGELTLTPSDLYAGFEARKVLLDKEGARLALDGRVFQFGRERQGVVTTDPIDLGPAEGVVGLSAVRRMRSVRIEVRAEVPEGAAIEVEARNGANPLDTSAWSPWRRLDGLAATLDGLAGRCLQVRMTLKATAADKLPALRALVLTPQVEAGTAWTGRLAVVEDKTQRIVRSPIEFHYERPDQKQLAEFRKAARLDAVVAGAKDDFERLVKLMDWVGSVDNVRGTRRERDGRAYAWNIEKVFEIGQDGKPHIHGHCMSYCEVMVTAATALGYVGARHFAICGFREASHEVPEVWVPSLGKWVFFDPSLTQFYFDKKNREPLSLIEMHAVVADTFLKDGEDMHWWCRRDNAEAQARVRVRRTADGQKPIGCRTGPWHYGRPAPKDYDWGWYHGYLAAGFVQMTPRNDFHSRPEANPRQFENYPGYAGYPNWVDAKTPPTRGGHNWFTRRRDFYWTLDQASLRLVEGDEGTLLVELGQSMPFFKAYRLKIDGVEAASPRSPFAWKLKPGRNRIEVAPEDEFGKIGLPSSVTVEYTKEMRP